MVVRMGGKRIETVTIRPCAATRIVCFYFDKVCNRQRIEQSCWEVIKGSEEMRLGILSEKYEGGGPATISTGEGDSGGVSYGTYQFATNTGTVDNFIAWLIEQGGVKAGYGAMLEKYPAGSLEFSNQWTWIAENEADFGEWQDEFVKPRYYDAAYEYAKEYGLAVELPFALQAVLFSNAIQHGAYWAGRLVAESYNPDPVEWITTIYDTKLNDMSWSSGAPSLRYGLFNRWENEKQDAIKLLEI